LARPGLAVDVVAGQGHALGQSDIGRVLCPLTVTGPIHGHAGLPGGIEGLMQ